MKKRLNRLFNYFLKGMSITVPFGAIIVITCKVLIKINEYILWTFPYIPFLRWSVKIHGLSFLITLLAITASGYIGSTLLISKMIAWLEYLVMKIPLINILYSYAKDAIFGFVDKLNEPVMVKITYGECEVYKVGFITQDKLHALSLKGDKVAIYLPHSCSFSGEMSIFPKDKVIPLDISKTEAMCFVLTGGLSEIKRPLISSNTRGKS